MNRLSDCPKLGVHMKPWYKKPSLWAGISGIAGGIVLCCTGNVLAGVPAIVAGVGLVVSGDKFLNRKNRP